MTILRSRLPKSISDDDAPVGQVTLGIDIGGTSVKAAVWSGGRCIRAGQSPFYVKPSPDQLRDAIRSAVGARCDVGSVGLCAPGLLDPARRVITLAINVPGLVGLPLDELVPTALGLREARPTLISNDAAAAAHDVFVSRQMQGRLLVVTIGTGVGIAVLDDGVPLHVEGDSPGHLGQIDVSIDGVEVMGPDGGAGGLEGYIGVHALQRDYGPDVSAALGKFAGDEPAILGLVRALRICHAIYRPNHICLSGGIGIRLRHLLPVIRERVRDRLTNLTRANWTIDCGTDDFEAARGAARLAAVAGDRALRDGAI